MKSIGILTLTPSNLNDFISNNLKKVFSNYVTINNYYLSQLTPCDVITDDIIVVTAQSHVRKAQSYISNRSRIIVLRRTLPNKEIYKISAIPKGANVLVVNDSPETTSEGIAFLCQVGITHLNLIPFDSRKEYQNINIAITFGEAKFVPRHIQTVIDVGHRCIDISTFLSILNYFNIDKKEISSRLIKYSDTVVTLDIGIENQYKELFMKNVQLDTVVNLSHNGIVLTDKNDFILLYNKKFSQLFEIYDSVIGQHFPTIFHNLVSQDLSEEYVDELIEFQNRSLLINSSKFEYFSEPAGTYYEFQEVTRIRHLEQSLAKKLHNKGLVTRYTFASIQAKSIKMQECIKLAQRMALSDLTVLIMGESGTGKELIAHSIHAASPRSIYPFVAINCASVPENLLESELFGYEAGSFTGAVKEGKPGLFEQANNGTIFLDEIGDMPLPLQVRLLRVLQERQIMRVGSQNVINVNIRVIAATNKNLLDEVQKGLFRQDLFYRLNVLPLTIPPLRERAEDILHLFYFFMKQHNKKVTFTEEAKSLLLKYRWPGNVRELANAVAYISFMATDVVDVGNLPAYILDSDTDFSVEFRYISTICDTEKVFQVLTILSHHHAGGLGRKSLEAECFQAGFVITESEIRRLLSIFTKFGWVNSQVGRGGSHLTAKGLAFIDWMQRYKTIVSP